MKPSDLLPQPPWEGPPIPRVLWQRILYHGAGMEFTEFKPLQEVGALKRFDAFLPEGEERAGYYFTPRFEEAQHYAMGASKKTGTPIVKAVTLDIKNPYFARPDEFGYYMTKNEQRLLEKQGYDGIVKVEKFADGTKQIFQVIAFKPSQIKMCREE